MAEDKKKKLKNLKQRVERYREKHAHTGKEAKGVSKPRRSQKKAPKMVGKRGGVFTPTKGGKEYKKALTKGAFKELLNELILEAEIKNFIEEVKVKEEIKKAVTSEAAVAEKVADDATLNGENKPAIEDAKSVVEAGKAVDVKAEAPKAEEQPVVEEKKEEAAKPELSFDGLFANDFALGSTIRQNPQGGSTVMNVKKPAMDYVERAKNHKNVSLTAEQLKELQDKKK